MQPSSVSFVSLPNQLSLPSLWCWFMASARFPLPTQAQRSPSLSSAQIWLPMKLMVGGDRTSPIITTKEGPCTSRGSPQVKPWTTKKTAVNDVNDEKDGHEASDKYASTDPWWNLEIHPQGKGNVGLLSAREMEFWHGYSKTTSVPSDVLLYSY